MFRGYDTERERLVAVKVFKLDLPPERVHQLVGAFERVIASDLAHPAIAEPIATGITSASAFLATDYVAADSMDLAIREFGAARPADALQSAAALAAALDQAASVNITHGCLHPRDVLMSSQETRLTGLGVAQALEQVGVSVPVRRPYTAPERITGSQWHRRADVFSLAALVHELLWGRRISAAGEQAADALTPLEDSDLAVLKRAFARALARDPADRFATATEFIEAIRTALPEAAAAPAPPPSSRRLRLAVNRRVPIEADPMAVLEQPRFADLDVDPEPIDLPRGPSILSIADEPEESGVPQETGVPAALEPAPPPVVVDLPDEPLVHNAASPVDVVAAVEPPVHEVHVEAHEESAVPVFVPEPATIELAAPVIAPVIAEPAPEPVAPPAPIAAAPAPASATDGPALFGASQDLSILDRSRSAVWPLMLALMIGVVLGFAGGYAVGLRDRPSTLASAGAGAPAAPGREFTESPVADAAKAPAGRVANPPSARSEPQAARGNTAKTPAAVRANAAQADKGAARPQPEAIGRLNVRTSPSGARVFVDDRDAGRTPAAVRDLAIGSHRVRLVRDGYTPEERRVVVSRTRSTVSMNVTLARVKAPVVAPPSPARLQAVAPPAPIGRGGLSVDSRPTGAKVFLDGKPVGTTPMQSADIPAGNHAIRLEHDGYRNWAASVTITANEQSRVTASLER